MKMIRSCSVALLALAACTSDVGSHGHSVDTAICVLQPVGDSGVTGRLLVTPTSDGVRIVGEVRGLTPGEHGFHVHEFGDLSDLREGKSAGGHFAPGGHDHGAREHGERHAGDLGNIVAGDDGVAKVDIRDGVIALGGKHSIVGRALVVHAERDDYGQPTGNAGARVAVGVIGIARR